MVLPQAATAAELGDLARELVATGRAAGLSAVGIARAEVFASTQHDLETRKRDGLHGGMRFTYRQPARSADPTRALPDAASLVVGALRYADEPGPRPAATAARVARYAWVDHYVELKRALSTVGARLKEEGWRARVLADDNALVDREAAYRAGLGWYGKNANLLLPGQGSWFVLGSVLTDAPLPATTEAVADGCGPCTRCLTGCPTGAIVAPGVVDARRCLAWLLQVDGDFPREHRVALGDRLYGCDDCQEVCPPNRRRAPVHAGEGATAWVAVLDLLAASDDELLDAHGRWYIPRREPRYLRRNALIVLGNTGDARERAVRATLSRYLADPDAMLRRHAAWAALRLGLDALVRPLAADPAIAVELDA
jgi:epoxyqueuosine reductase